MTRWIEDTVRLGRVRPDRQPPPLRLAVVARDEARPTIVRRGPPCGAALDARCTGARTDRAPVHRAQPADHGSCIAVHRRAPRRPAYGGRASSYHDHCRRDGGGVKEHAGRAPRASAPAPAARRHGQGPGAARRRGGRGGVGEDAPGPLTIVGRAHRDGMRLIIVGLRGRRLRLRSHGRPRALRRQDEHVGAVRRRATPDRSRR